MAVVEDESLFGILVAGDTPGNLHQDKLGEYIRRLSVPHLPSTTHFAALPRRARSDAQDRRHQEWPARLHEGQRHQPHALVHVRCG